jgi:hypothetical protein
MLSALHAPEKVKRLFPVLLGKLGGRSYTVPFWRLDLARRMFGDQITHWIDGSLSSEDKSRMEDRVSDYLSALRDWISENSLEGIVTYSPARQRGEQSKIRTPMFSWIRTAADLAGDRISPDHPDDAVRRRVVAESVKTVLDAKRLKQLAPEGRKRRKRPMRDDAHLKASITHFRKYWLAKFGVKNWNDPDEFKASIIRELEEKFLPEMIVEGGVNNPPYDDDFSGNLDADYRTEEQCYFPATGNWCDQFEGTQGGEYVTDPVADDAHSDTTSPPCAPSLPDSIELSDSARSLIQCTAGRDGDHWRALHAAASVGGVPVALLRKDGDIRHCIPEDVNSLTHFLSEFDSRVAASIDARESFILRLSEVFMRDDCKPDDRDKLERFAFMTVETSPGSYHCWFRLAAGQSRADFHAALNAAGLGGNAGGTSSGRWPGTVNGKPERDGWIVRLVSVAPGRVASLEQVRAAFPAVADDDAHQPPQTPQKPRIKKPVSSGIVKRSENVRFPDYAKCLRDKNGDRSEADGSFITIAADYHFTADEIFSELRRVSERFGSLTEKKAWNDFDSIWSKFVRV